MNVPFYQKLYKDISIEEIKSIRTAEDLQKLPIVDKNEYRNAPLNERFAKGFSPDNTVGNYTSGSSGKPLHFYNSENDLEYLRMMHLNDLIQAGLRPWDRVAYFKLGKYKEHFLEKYNIMPFYHIPTNLPIEEKADIFLKVQPTMLTGFFSTIYLLSRELEKRGIKYTKV
jgi:phenylacetate-CoA ligase